MAHFLLTGHPPHSTVYKLLIICPYIPGFPISPHQESPSSHIIAHWKTSFGTSHHKPSVQGEPSAQFTTGLATSDENMNVCITRPSWLCTGHGNKASVCIEGNTRATVVWDVFSSSLLASPNPTHSQCDSDSHWVFSLCCQAFSVKLQPGHQAIWLASTGIWWKLSMGNQGVWHRKYGLMLLF